MNILELITKQHPQVRVERWDAAAGAWTSQEQPAALITKVVDPRVEWRGWRPRTVRHLVRGVRLDPGTRVVVREAARHWPVFASGHGVFYAQGVAGSTGELDLGWGDAAAPMRRVSAGARLRQVQVPATADHAADLVLEAPAASARPVFLGVHRLLDRELLYAHCRGRGVEIGPGPKPQILPAPDVDVRYVEQATPDQWQALYGKDSRTPVDPSLWDRYIVGNADNVPAAPGTLDFIFSSHVVEHLSNPLGHLAYWCKLLRPGGVVAAVIPDMEGCKDFVFKPSTRQELEEELAEGSMEVNLRHYKRWAAHRASGQDPAEIMATGRSIHVHFYTPASMGAVLDHSATRLGFRKAQVISSPNHKDFFVLLRK